MLGYKPANLGGSSFAWCRDAHPAHHPDPIPGLKRAGDTIHYRLVGMRFFVCRCDEIEAVSGMVGHRRQSVPSSRTVIIAIETDAQIPRRDHHIILRGN